MNQNENQKPEEIEVAPDPAVDEQQQEFSPPPADPTPEPEPKPEPTRVAMSPKDQERLEIAKRFTASRQDPQDVDYHGDHNDPTQHYGAVAKGPEPEQPEQPQPEPQAQPEPAPRKIKLTVRRQEIELPEDEVIAHAQKALAADTYFDDAKRIYEDARRAAPSRPHPDENQPAPAAEETIDDLDNPQPHPEADEFEELVEKIQYGDKKEAAEVLRTTLTKITKQSSLEQSWEEKINNDLVSDTQTYQEFAARNAELAKDENAVAVIKKNLLDGYREDLRKIGVPEDRIPKDETVLAQHHRVYKLKGQPVRTVGQLLEDAKGRFVQWRGGAPAQQKATQQPNGNRPAVNVNRSDRREAIPHQPSRAAVPPQMQRSQTPAAPTDRSEIVRRAREARGQV